MSRAVPTRAPAKREDSEADERQWDRWLAELGAGWVRAAVWVSYPSGEGQQQAGARHDSGVEVWPEGHYWCAWWEPDGEGGDRADAVSGSTAREAARRAVCSALPKLHADLAEARAEWLVRQQSLACNLDARTVAHHHRNSPIWWARVRDPDERQQQRERLRHEILVWRNEIERLQDAERELEQALEALAPVDA